MIFNEANYLYEIGESVYVYTREDEFEQTVIRDREQRLSGMNWYLVEWGWEREAFLRKINPLK